MRAHNVHGALCEDVCRVITDEVEAYGRTVGAAVRARLAAADEAEEEALLARARALGMAVSVRAMEDGVTFACACATCTATYSGNVALERHLAMCLTHKPERAAVPHLSKKAQRTYNRPE